MLSKNICSGNTLPPTSPIQHPAPPLPIPVNFPHITSDFSFRGRNSYLILGFKLTDRNIEKTLNIFKYIIFRTSMFPIQIESKPSYLKLVKCIQMISQIMLTCVNTLRALPYSSNNARLVRAFLVTSSVILNMEILYYHPFIYTASFVFWYTRQIQQLATYLSTAVF